MNNSLIIESVSLELEQPADKTELLRQKETELIQIIEALSKVIESREWAVLKDKIFDGVVESLERRLKTEIKKKPLNGPLIHSLNGQIEWAEKYSNLESLAHIYKQELTNVRNQFNA